MQQADDESPVIGRRTLLQAASGLVAAVLAEAEAFDRSANAAATLEFATLTPGQTKTVAAIADRIWPGADAAGAVVYIDRALAGAYRRQARLYRFALPRLETAAQQRFGMRFEAIGGSQQDLILADLAAGRLTVLPGARGAALFEMLRKHVIEGVLSDPVHGGNRDFLGWKAVGYPGPYRVHTEPDQTSTAPLNMPYQSIKDL